MFLKQKTINVMIGYCYTNFESISDI